ncbi:MAG: hypothetical protein HUK03_09585 [Bacteroidaceae bacterium]|nr:hypothetical protein [Bacteroidaceae bacterium]
MNEKEIFEMLRRIDDGIRLAQERLWENARKEHQSLIVVEDGVVVEYYP